MSYDKMFARFPACMDEVLSNIDREIETEFFWYLIACLEDDIHVYTKAGLELALDDEFGGGIYA